MRAKVTIGTTVAGMVLLGLSSTAQAQVQAWAASTLNELEDLAVDIAGNVVVTGSVSAGGSDDYVTMKYDLRGNLLWSAQYGGPVSWRDAAEAVALDDLGNVYVTGTSDGANYFPDCVTIKYDSQGREQWVARFAGPSGRAHYGKDLAVDGAGNVFVTGSFTVQGSRDGYLTLKYDSSGNQLWAQLYDGPAYIGWEGAEAIALDAAGNVYVTGGSIGLGTGFDFATIKYDGQGNQQWIARFDGPRQGSDMAADLAVDATGNVYVTGFSWDVLYDYATVKYDSQGNQLWVARYDGPANWKDWPYDVEIDDAGNVYVTGDSFGIGAGTYYSATVKYDGQGNQQWVARRQGSGTALAVDSAGHTYVTGARETVSYDGNGKELWVAAPASILYAEAIAIDGTGQVYVAGTATIQYVPYGFQPYGRATAGSAGLAPQLAGTGSATLGSAISLDVSNGFGAALGAVMMGESFASQITLPILGGTMLVQPATSFAVALGGTAGSPGAGQRSLPLQLPSDPAAAGVNVNFQAAFLDPGAPSGVSMTNGLALWIGKP